MSDLLHNPVFLSLAAGVLIVLGTTIIHHWSRVRRASLEADLKLELIRQGMSADEICKVVESRPSGRSREHA